VYYNHIASDSVEEQFGTVLGVYCIAGTV